MIEVLEILYRWNKGMRVKGIVAELACSNIHYIVASIIKIYRLFMVALTSIVRHKAHSLKIGNVINGPGESKHANIGISLPGSGELPVAPVFIDAYKAHTLRGNTIVDDFKFIITSYITKKYGDTNVASS